MNKLPISTLVLTILFSVVDLNPAQAQQRVLETVMRGLYNQPAGQQLPRQTSDGAANQNRGVSHESNMLNEIRQRPDAQQLLSPRSQRQLNQDRTLYSRPEEFTESQRPTDINVDRYGDNGRGQYVPLPPSSRSAVQGSQCSGGVAVLGQCDGILTDTLRGHRDYQAGGRNDPNRYYIDPSLQPPRR